MNSFETSQLRLVSFKDLLLPFQGVAFSRTELKITFNGWSNTCKDAPPPDTGVSDTNTL